MKFIKYIISILALTLLFTSCEIDNNGPMPNDIDESAVGYIKQSANTVLLLDKGNPSNFNFEGSMNILYDAAVDNADLVVAYKSISSATGDYDYSDEKQYVLISGVKAFPHEFSISVEDIIAAIPEISSVDDVEVGDGFKFFINTEVGGTTYRAYTQIETDDGPISTTTISSSLRAIITNLYGSDSKGDATASVPCAYDAAQMTGSYSVTSDWYPGTVTGVTLTPDPTDPYTINVVGLASAEGLVDANPLPMIISQADHSVYAPKTLIAADWAPWGYSYTGYSYEGTGSVNVCDGSFIMTFSVTVDQGGFGSFVYKFVKE